MSYQIRFLAALLIAVLLPGTALAWNYRDTIAGNMTVEICTEGQWYELSPVMRYSHENGIVADGILVFMPLEEYVANRELPTLPLGNDLQIRTTCTSFITSCKTSWMLYQYVDQQLIPLQVDTSGLADLTPGCYLLVLQISAQGLSGSSSSQCMVWVTVGDALPPDTLLPRTTPIATPTPPASR